MFFGALGARGCEGSFPSLLRSIHLPLALTALAARSQVRGMWPSLLVLLRRNVNTTNPLSPTSCRPPRPLLSQPGRQKASPRRPFLAFISMQEPECLDRTTWTSVCLLPLLPGMLWLVQHKSRSHTTLHKPHVKITEQRISAVILEILRQGRHNGLSSSPRFLDPSLHASHRRHLCFPHSHIGINSSGSVFFMAGLQNPLKY